MLAALLLGKTAEAAERGAELVITGDTELGVVGIAPRDLVTIVGNLIDLPKGISGPTLDAIVLALRAERDGLPAGAVADATGVSRVTARRYLEYLADHGLAGREPRYGQVGRPEVWYRAMS